MFQNFGITEILLILLIVVLIFGMERINRIAKELGSSIRSFREGLKGDEEEKKEETKLEK